MKAARYYKIARLSLLFMIVVTLVDMALVLTDNDSIYLFSNTLAHLFVLGGRELSRTVGIAGPLGGNNLEQGLILAVVVLLSYLLCWIFSGRRRGWMILALVLFGLDTLILLRTCSQMFDDFPLWDIVFHAVMLVCLALGVFKDRGAAAETTRQNEEESAQT